MQCSQCGADNPAEYRFCSECGSALVAACPDCGHPNPPHHRFCSECGTGLGDGSSPPSVAPTAGAERRFVSVLFADLAGFTSFSESRDSEEVRSVVTSYYERAAEIVDRFGGYVDKFIGDAVMAVWGAVETHEDDAERAVRAGLELVAMVADLAAEIGVAGFTARAGVLSGETAIGPGGNEDRLVVGDLVNTASRLESLAPPGAVLVGEATYRLVREGIAFEPHGTHDVKGKTEPVAAYRALRVVAETGGRGRASGLEAPFVGRSVEMRMLKDQLHATGREGRSRLVSIIGEAGIGKSRLVWELLKYIDGLVEPIYWHEGRSPAYGDGVTFWALGEMVRQRAGIAATDDPAKSRMKLRTAVAEYLTEPEDQRWVEPRLAGLLGLDDVPAGDRVEMFSALRTFFQRIAKAGTTVLVFEDLHWADTGLVEFVQDLVERSGAHPILVITVSRPDLLERRPGWGSGRSNSVSMQLGPLADEEIEALVAGMVPGVDREMSQQVADRAAGVPLYAVEIVRMLVNEGALALEDGDYRVVREAAPLGIPDSLQAVVGARLDRLEPEVRSVIQDAAVLGYAFTADGLASLRGTPGAEVAQLLAGLVRRELLQLVDDPRSPERGQYRFVQSLIREVAYSRLSRDERRQRHLEVAESYRALADPEMAGIVASHYLDALEASLSAEDEAAIAVLARDALQDAAERARDLHSYEQAHSLYRRALELTEDPGTRARMLTESSPSVEALGYVDEAIDQLRRAIATFVEVDDEDGRLAAVTRLADLFNSNMRSDDAAALLEPEYQGLGELDSDLRIRLATEMGRSLMLVGRDEEASKVADKALAAAEAREWIPLILSGLVNRGTALANLGRVREGVALLNGAVQLGEETDHLWHQGRALNNLSSILSAVDPMAAHEASLQVLAVVERLGHPAWTYRAVTDLAHYSVSMGEYEHAAGMLDDLATDNLPDEWELTVEGVRGRIDMARVGAEAGIDRWREYLTEWGSLPDPQARYFSGVLLAQAQVRMGEPAAGYEAATALDGGFGTQYPGDLEVALNAAVALRDLAKVEAVVDALAGPAGSGSMVRGLRRYASGAAAALRGDQEEAAAMFGAALDEWEGRAMAVDITALRVDFARLVGIDHPQARAAAEAAQAWVEQTGSYGLAAAWADGLPPGAHATVVGG